MFPVINHLRKRLLPLFQIRSPTLPTFSDYLLVALTKQCQKDSEGWPDPPRPHAFTNALEKWQKSQQWGPHTFLPADLLQVVSLFRKAADINQKAHGLKWVWAMPKVTKRQPAVHMPPLVYLPLTLHGELKNSVPYEVRGVKLRSSAWTSLFMELRIPANLYVWVLRDVRH